jgi:SAM-dependent methyltransferase
MGTNLREDSLMRAAVVEGWRLVFDEAYDGGVQDWSFDIRGWKGGDGREIPPQQMREWVSSTLGRLAAEKPRRLLEIGCGTGLLTWQLAPLVEEYVGLDFSDVVVEQLRSSAREHAVDNVSFQVGEASQLDALVEGEFDTIVLNSVCQYFPDEQYLGEVLGKARGRLAAGGTIYLGDVRDSRLGLHCHFDIAGRLPADSAGDAHQRLELARSRLSRESELLIAPAFFEAVAAAEPSLWCAVLPRRGWSANELTRYRYDVLLRHQPPSPAAAQRLTWGVDVHGLAELGTALLAATGPVLVDSIPNARLGDVDAQLSAALDEAAPDRSAAGVEPEAVLALAPPAFVAEVYLDRHPCLFQAVFAPSRASLLSTRPLPVSQG